MDIKFKDESETQNPGLTQPVSADTKLKTFLVEYAGEKKTPVNDEVTVATIVDVLTEEFPELILALAEENWIRGYHQAFHDIETTTEKVFEAEVNEQ